MKALNAHERTTGLLQFAGLFLATVILVTVAIYFNVKTVPQVQLAGLQVENAKLLDSVSSVDKFNSQLVDMNNQLVAYSNDPSNEVLAEKVTRSIVGLDAIAKNDTISYIGRMVNQFAMGYGIAANTIKKLKASGNASEDITKLQEQLKQAKDDLKDKDQQINNLNIQLALKGGGGGKK